MRAFGVGHLAPAAAALGIVLVAQDRHQPGVQVGALAVLVAVGDRLGQGLLHQVVGPVAVPAQRPGEAAQHRDRPHEIVAKGRAHELALLLRRLVQLGEKRHHVRRDVLLQRLVVDPAQLVGDPVLLAHAPATASVAIRGFTACHYHSTRYLSPPCGTKTQHASPAFGTNTLHALQCAIVDNRSIADGTFSPFRALPLSSRPAAAGQPRCPEDELHAHQPFARNRSPPALPAPLRPGADRFAGQRRRACDRLPRGDRRRSLHLRRREVA